MTNQTLVSASFVKANPHFVFQLLDGSQHEGICLVHGGAWDIPADLSANHQKGVQAAFDELTSRAAALGNDPLQLIVTALASLEQDPTFDAGYGSFLNERGDVELDAGVMEGESLKAGAVASLGAFYNPGRIALAVLNKTDHVLLVGQGATAFAIQQGFESVSPSALVHPREQIAFDKWIAAGKPHAQTFFASSPANETKSTNLSGSLAGAEPHKRGTVGVVLAVRPQVAGSQWKLFCGTSTGGTPGKMWGRVGDVPIPGAGFYADDEGACVSATGWGEAFLRTLPCKKVSDLCADGMHPQKACEVVLSHMLRRTGGRGGLIAISKTGLVGTAFSTPDMAIIGLNCTQIGV